jgi:hypothetical protein
MALGFLSIEATSEWMISVSLDGLGSGDLKVIPSKSPGAGGGFYNL